MKADIRSMDMAELAAFYKDLGEAPFRAKQAFSWLHGRLCEDFSEMSDLKKELRRTLGEKAFITPFEVAEELLSKDGTKKFLFRLGDGVLVESVLMSYEHGRSVCVSTQAGCAMDCAFCASGKGGFERNLTASEICGQIYTISRRQKERIGHVVFMGMGEPLVNYDSVIRAIRLLADPAGQNISPRNMTISTCGIVPGIRRLAEEGLPVTLALSLHAPTQEIRETIMPIAKTYGLSEVLNACEEYRKITKRRVTYEYCLIPGVNDSEKEAEGLVRLFKGSDAHVNLIPWHRISEQSYKGSPDAASFKNKLEKNRINVTIRRGLGQDIDASCGQLRLKGKRDFIEV